MPVTLTPVGGAAPSLFGRRPALRRRQQHALLAAAQQGEPHARRGGSRPRGGASGGNGRQRRSTGGGKGDSDNRAINGWLLGACSVEALLEVVDLRHADLNDVNVATALHRLHRLLDGHPAPGSPAAQTVAALAEHVAAHAATYNTTSLCHALVALSGLRYGAAEPFEAAQAALTARADDLGSLAPHHLSRLLTALRPSGYASRDLFAALAPRIAAGAGAFDVRSLSCATLAYAQLGMRAPALFDAAGDAFVARAAEFQGSSLAAAVRSLALAGRPHRGLVDAATQLVAGGTLTLRPDVAVSLARGLATSGSPAALAAVEASLTGRLSSCSPGGLATLMWSFAKGGHQPGVDTLEKAAGALVAAGAAGLRSTDAARLLWAYARFGNPPPPPLRHVLLTAVRAQLSACSGQELVNVLWAAASLRLHLPADFADIAAELAAPGRADLTPQGAALALWAHAVMGLPAPGLCAAVTAFAAPRLGEFEPKNLAILVWALGALGALRAPLLTAAARQLDASPGRWAAKDLRSVYQADLLLRAAESEEGGGAPRGGFLPPRLAAAARAAWRSAPRPAHGPLKASVGAALARLGVASIAEGVTADGDMRADFLVTGPRGEAIALEVLTHSKYAANQLRRPLGQVALREALLLDGRTDGVVHVPHWEWAALGGQPRAEESYLRSTLAWGRSLAEPPSAPDNPHADREAITARPTRPTPAAVVTADA